MEQELGISRYTLYRRLREEGILENLQFTDVSDDDLDDIILQIKLEHPNDGEVLIAGHLVALGNRIPCSRLCASIHRLDPAGVVERRRWAVVRRVHSVGEPNEVWHFDGHQKLIRWQFVIREGVDGYSRTIVFLRCSTDNTAATVLLAFISAVEKYGLPQRVRSDLGGENVEVWRFILAQHSVDIFKQCLQIVGNHIVVCQLCTSMLVLVKSPHGGM